MTLLLSVMAALTACGSSPARTEASARDPVYTPPSQERARARTAVSTLGERAASIALQQVGVPYRYGGTSPTGFDCSGLVHYSYSRAGGSVPRTTGQLWESTSRVDRADLRPGDLIFFSINGKMQHVGMYIGGNEFVHAPSSGKQVSVASLSTAYYNRAFLRAGRPR
ncbi:MAG: C40 family peptidase [Woeseiaceae bacterium]|nr:C40 family peptidase [Woeseiaceae bacterium]